MIFLTTHQWENKSYSNKIIDKGELCVEITTDNKMLLKIGNGNIRYKELPYISNVDASLLDDYYVKTEIDMLLLDKVNIVEGKELSTNDFSNYYKEKIYTIVSEGGIPGLSSIRNCR